ncbi:Cytochrome b5 isoform A [Trichoplax sp. H2]|uniref:Cytochrome b5 n=1 Tax=Trichoplax adhaerens TaxID=10228 RepID=B3RRK4_TRIAD|nr:hypothetical protein TRIADDRAFT_54274 [Trichoplax adhaerens]EDV26889.1 hypothetical protein TRIADDRAFT_54274 [Trichoplax adhaerens]RDD39699.1 Cytochrome b5 isoform A [Trichoplax sp. H2]|eukprot:XP_002110885.1 hypothetical protein TRIADDRAFT_54274 [Trichoplax adhaerens]
MEQTLGTIAQAIGSKAVQQSLDSHRNKVKIYLITQNSNRNQLHSAITKLCGQQIKALSTQQVLIRVGKSQFYTAKNQTQAQAYTQELQHSINSRLLINRHRLQSILSSNDDQHSPRTSPARELLEMWDQNPETRPEGHVYYHGFYPPKLITDPHPDQLPDKCRALFLFAKNLPNSYSPRFREKVRQLPNIGDEIESLPKSIITILHSAAVNIALIYWNYYGKVNGFDIPKLPDNLQKSWVHCCRILDRIPSNTNDTQNIDNIDLKRPEEGFSFNNLKMRFPFFNVEDLGSCTEISFHGYSLASLRYACYDIVDAALDLQSAMYNGDKDEIIIHLNKLIEIANRGSETLSEPKFNSYAEISIIPSHWRHIGQTGPIAPNCLLDPSKEKTSHLLTEANLDWYTAKDEELFAIAEENSLIGNSTSGLFDPIFAVFDIIIDRIRKSLIGKMFSNGYRLIPKSYRQFLTAFKLGFEKTGSPKQFIKALNDSQLNKTFDLFERSYHRMLDIHRNKALGVLSLVTQLDRTVTVTNQETESKSAHIQLNTEFNESIDDRQFTNRLFSATIHSTPANLNQRNTLQYVTISIYDKKFSYQEGDKLGVLIPNTITNYDSAPQYFVLDIHTKDTTEKEWIKFVHNHFGISNGKVSKEIFIKYADFTNNKPHGSPSIVPPQLPRTYNIASFDNDNIKLLVERIDNGKVSPILAPIDNLFDQHQVIDVFPINSSFRLPQDSSKPIVMIGIGSGIAPYQSFIDRNKKMNENRRMLLYFGCRTIEDAPDTVNYTKLCLSADNIQKWKGSQYSYIYNGRVTSYFSSSEGQNKLIELCKEDALIYICGPTTLYRDMIRIFKSAIGIKELIRMLTTDRIKIEVYKPITNDCKMNISIYDIVTHNGGRNGCWIVIDRRVYDIGEYIDLHPGGDEMLKFVLGTDATELFNQFPTAHGKMARSILELYYIGDVITSDSYYERLAYDVTKKQNCIAIWYGDKQEKQYHFLMKSLDAHIICRKYFNTMNEVLVQKDIFAEEFSALQVIHEYNELIKDKRYIFPYKRNNEGDLLTEDDEFKIMETLHEYKAKTRSVDIYYLDKLKRALAKHLNCINSEA